MKLEYFTIYKKIQILSIILGALISLFLWYEYVVAQSVVCPISNCNAVMASEYSKFLGVPLPAMGFAFFAFSAFILAEIYFIDNLGLKRIFIVLTSFGLAYTLFLRVIEFVYIHAWCIWCWVTFICCIILFITTILEAKKT